MKISDEDKKILDSFAEGLKQAVVTGGEVSMSSLSKYIASLSPSTISNLSKMCKTYSYAGVFFALQESLQVNSNDPLYKYGLAALGYTIATGTGCISAPAIVIALGISALVEGAWQIGEWIAENQEDILKKIKKLLENKGFLINEDGMIQCTLPGINICPIPRDETICKIKDLFGVAEETRSPLVIDLDGDGIETLTTAGGVYFDHDGNGFRENSGWVGQDDGLLVRDINGNGQIDDGSELFGNHTLLSNGEKAANGFEALKDLDSNGDGVFNASDEAWNQIMIWQDRNSNGKVDSGELLTLESAGIAGIDLDYTHQEVVDANGNAHKQSGTVVKNDGTTGSIADVWFDANPEATIDDLQTEIPEAVLALPNISGSGNVHDLHAAMALA